jgi:N utilization substance protein B
MASFRAKRRKTRSLLIQALYQQDMSNAATHEILAEYFSDRSDKKLDVEFFEQALRACINKKQSFLEQINGHGNIPAGGMDKVTEAVILLAVYELSERVDVPYKVVIDEALELSKKYGASDSYRFINGLLNSVATEVRAEEVKEQQNNSSKD